MAGRRHLFVAVVRTAFGEVLQGRRVAEALVATGDHVSFVAPAEIQSALVGAQVRRGVLEQFGTRLLDSLLPQLAASERYDSICLVDLASVALAFGQLGLSLDSLRGLPAVALDLWSLAETDRVFDFGGTRQQLPAEILAIPHLVPVPFARPEVAGGYAAWAPNQPLNAEERAATRARIGLAADERVIVLATATWQMPERQSDATARASALALPARLLALVEKTGATLVHVGPSAWAPPSARYRHVPQLPAREFEAIIGAADAVLTANLAATTIATALAAEVPIIAVTCDGGAVPPFRVWPLGLHHLLAPVLAQNPLLELVRTVDLFDEAGFVAAFSPDATYRDRVRAYRARVDALPTAAERYAQLTGSRA